MRYRKRLADLPADVRMDRDWKDEVFFFAIEVGECVLPKLLDVSCIDLRGY